MNNNKLIWVSFLIAISLMGIGGYMVLTGAAIGSDIRISSLPPGPTNPVEPPLEIANLIFDNDLGEEIIDIDYGNSIIGVASLSDNSVFMLDFQGNVLWSESISSNKVAIGDPDGDGEEEIIIGSLDGNLAIFSADSSTIFSEDFENGLNGWESVIIGCENLDPINVTPIDPPIKPPIEPPLIPPMNIVNDNNFRISNMELSNGNGSNESQGWILTDTSLDGWQFDSTRFGTYGNGMSMDICEHSYALSPVIDLTNMSSAQLTFDSWAYDEGSCPEYDAEYIEISVDGGLNWTTISSCPEYPLHNGCGEGGMNLTSMGLSVLETECVIDSDCQGHDPGNACSEMCDAGNCTFAPDQTPCDSEFECQGAGECDGQGSCIATGYDPEGTPCGDLNVECHLTDICDAQGMCMDMGYVDQGTSCGEVDVECQGDSECDGQGSCTATSYDPEGTPCDDGDQCPQDGMCDMSGNCVENIPDCLTNEDCAPNETCSGCICEAEPIQQDCDDCIGCIEEGPGIEYCCSSYEPCDGCSECGDNNDSNCEYPGHDTSFTYNLTEFTGETIQIRFRYDTLDNCCGFEEGWYIDNVVVSGSVGILEYYEYFDCTFGDIETYNFGNNYDSVLVGDLCLGDTIVRLDEYNVSDFYYHPASEIVVGNVQNETFIATIDAVSEISIPINPPIDRTVVIYDENLNYEWSFEMSGIAIDVADVNGDGNDEILAAGMFSEEVVTPAIILFSYIEGNCTETSPEFCDMELGGSEQNCLGWDPACEWINQNGSCEHLYYCSDLTNETACTNETNPFMCSWNDTNCTNVDSCNNYGQQNCTLFDMCEWVDESYCDFDSCEIFTDEMECNSFMPVCGWEHGSWQPVWGVPLNDLPLDVKMGDMDGDGLNDEFAVIDAVMNSLTLFSDGDILWTVPDVYGYLLEVPMGQDLIQMGDVDNDGLDELVVGTVNGSIMIYDINGTNEQGFDIIYAIENAPYEPPGGGGVNLLGAPGPEPLPSIGYPIVDLDLVDLTGNGVLDIIVTSNGHVFGFSALDESASKSHNFGYYPFTALETFEFNSEELGVSVELSVKNDSFGTIAIERFEGPNPTDANFGVLGLNIYANIIATYEIGDNLENAEIRIYYDQEDVDAAGIDESTLSMYYYNEELGEWVVEADSGVNTVEDYVWANVNHFSFFAPGGFAPVVPTSSSGGSSGGALVIDLGNLTDNISFSALMGQVNRFHYMNKTHTIKLGLISGDIVDLYLEGSLYKITLSDGESGMLDLNGNDEDDFKITLDGIGTNTVDATMFAINESEDELPVEPEKLEPIVPEQIMDETDEEPLVEEDDMTMAYILVGVGALMLLALLYKLFKRN